MWLWQFQAIQALGVVIYHALDYGLQESEERHLSRDLEHLLEVMINPDEEEDEELQNACDEGIEKDAKEGYTFADIIVVGAGMMTKKTLLSLSEEDSAPSPSPNHTHNLAPWPPPMEEMFISCCLLTDYICEIWKTKQAIWTF